MAIFNFQDGYFDDSEKKVMKSDLLTAPAEKLGKALVDNQLTTNQLRNFYQELREIHLSFKQAAHGIEEPKEIEEKFKKFLPLIMLVIAKVAYNRGRKMNASRGIDPYKDLSEFMKDGISNIKTHQDFDAFMLVFEAVVGYFKGSGGRDS